MTRSRLSALACVVLAALFVILAVLYFGRTAADLPRFLPGHAAGSTRHHVKHGIAMLGLAAISLVGAWMLTGSARTAPGSD